MKKFLGNLFVALFLFTLWMGTMGETAMAEETGNLEKQTQWILISSKKVGKVYMDENSITKKGNLALVETKVEPADGGTPTYLYQVMNREQKKFALLVMSIGDNVIYAIKGQEDVEWREIKAGTTAETLYFKIWPE